MPLGISKGFKLPAPPRYTGSNDATSIATWLAQTLYRWLENLVVKLESQFDLLSQQTSSTVSISGRTILPFSGTIVGNGAQDDIYRINSSADFTISRAAVWYRGAANGTTPIVRIGSAASGGGTGISITLDATTKDRGSGTGAVTITAGSAIFVNYTDCNNLGIGEIYLDFA